MKERLCAIEHIHPNELPDVPEEYRVWAAWGYNRCVDKVEAALAPTRENDACLTCYGYGYVTEIAKRIRCEICGGSGKKVNDNIMPGSEEMT